jgi:glycosyltransferase involved in cell wall biosynthesis
MLTNLALKMVLMITYLSHWDWILYKSRKELIAYLGSQNIHAMCPDGDYVENLNKFYKSTTNWEVERERLLDFKAILNLRKHIKNIQTNYHCFTLKTGLLFAFANIGISKKRRAILSVTGLGFMFTNNRKAKLLRFLIKPFIRKLMNNTYDVIIFQNHSDKEVFINFSKFSNKIEIIPSSGIETNKFIIRKNKKNQSKPIKIILVSRLLYDKGILDYLELVEMTRNKNYEFYLAGERDHGNPQNITDEDMNRILGNKNLKYLGKIDVETELSNFDISIIMSSHEGFSRILLESLYVGLYCLAYRIQGTEVMGHFKNLELIPMNQINEFKKCIENFKGDIDNLYNMQLVEESYTSRVVAFQFEKIYKDLDVHN